MDVSNIWLYRMLFGLRRCYSKFANKPLLKPQTPAGTGYRYSRQVALVGSADASLLSVHNRVKRYLKGSRLRFQRHRSMAIRKDRYWAISSGSSRPKSTGRTAIIETKF